MNYNYKLKKVEVYNSCTGDYQYFIKFEYEGMEREITIWNNNTYLLTILNGNTINEEHYSDLNSHPTIHHYYKILISYIKGDIQQ